MIKTVRFTNTLKFGLLCALGFLHLQAQADRDPFLIMQPIPQSGANIKSFIPEGWYLESKVEGDLDGNGTLDSVVVIRDTTQKYIDEEVAADSSPSEWVDGNRGLMVLLKGIDGTYQFAGLGKNILLCSRCYGMDVGPKGGYPDIRIKNQVIIIHQVSRVQNGTLRFRYDKTAKYFRLIGVEDDSKEKAGCDEQESINYLTNTRISRTWVCQDENGDELKGPQKYKEYKEKIKPAVWTLENYHFFDNPE